MRPARSSRRAETALSGTLFALGAQLTTAIFTAVVTLYLVRALGPEGYGELALVLSVGGLVLVVADLAVAQSTARFVAVEFGDPARVAAVVSAGLRLKLLVSTAAGLGLVLVAGPVAQAYDEPQMTWALRAAALAVVAESLVMLWLVVFQALRRIATNVQLYFVESLAEALAIVSLVAAGTGVTGAVLGRGIGYAVGAVAGAVLLMRAVGRRLDLRGDPEMGRRISAYARPLFVGNSAYTLYTHIDVQLIGMLLTRSAVGLFAAPMRIAVLLGYPGQSVASAVAPRMAGQNPDVATFNAAMRWLLVYQTALLAPVLVWSEPIVVLLLGAEFRSADVVLAALAPYLFLNGMSMLITTTVNYLGQARRRIPIVLLSLAVQAALCAVLLPLVGVVGAPIATAVSYGIYVPLHVRICRESFALPLRPLARTFARCALAALAAAAVLAAVGTTDLSPAQWAAGAVGSGGAYLAVLVATRELTGREARQALAALRSLRARRHDRRRTETSPRSGGPCRKQEATKPVP